MKYPMSISVSSRRGSALVAVVIFGAIMSLCAAYAYRSTLYQNRMAERSQSYVGALAIAEAGAELAMMELNKNAGVTPVAFTGWSGTTTKKYAAPMRDHDNAIVGEMEIEVIDVTAEKPKIVSTGYVPNKQNALLARTVQLTTKNDTVPSPFGAFGIFGFNKVDLTGSGDIRSNVGTLGDFEKTGSGKITGNVQAAGDISMKGSGDVTGDVDYGGSIDEKGSGNIHGTKTKGSSPTPPPAIDPPVHPSDPPLNNVNSQIKYDNKNANVATGGTADMSGSKDMLLDGPGTYDLKSLNHTGSGDLIINGPGDVVIYCRDSFTIKGSGDIKVGNDVNLTIVAKNIDMVGSHDLNIYGDGQIQFFSDDFKISGSGDLNLYGDAEMIIYTGELKKNGSGDLNGVGNKNPGQLQIFSSGSSRFVGSSNVYAGIYAPNSDFELKGSGDWFGAIIGKTVGITGSGKVNSYDPLLVPTEGDGAFVTSWLEIAPQK